MLTVIIGNQEWGYIDLDVSTFKNGDPIPEAKTAVEWVMAAEKRQPACYIIYDDYVDDVMGRFYNGYCLYDDRGLAPDGFRIPTAYDWATLSSFLGDEVAARRMLPAEFLQMYYPGTEASGFSAYLGGCRKNNGLFEFSGERAFWWALDGQFDQDYAGVRSIHLHIGDIDEAIVPKAYGFSVRCLRDI